MNIVITGAAGFLGTAIVSSLKKDHKIIAFDNLMYNQGDLVRHCFHDVEFYLEDVTKWSDNLKTAISNADMVIGLSAIVGMPNCKENPELAYRVNYEFYKNLLNYLDDQLILSFNSNSAYGTTLDLVDETYLMNPISIYAETKQKMEEALFQYDKTIGYRLATVFAVGNSYRPRLDLLVNSLTYEAVTKGHIEIFDDNFYRNYLSIRDLTDLVKFSILNKHKMINNVFNIGSDELNCTKLELAKKICQVTGATYSVKNDRTDPDSRNYRISNEKIKKFGWEAKHPLESGVKEVVKLAPFVEDIRKYKNY